MNTITNEKELRIKILPKVLIRFSLGFVLFGILIFAPAGTIHFFNGWLFILGFLVPMIFAVTYLLYKDPELIEKRIRMKEKEEAQKKYVTYSLFLFLITYIIPGLDYRYNWSDVPVWLVWLSFIVMIAGYVIFITVMLQNRYASKIIEIQNGQKLIDTGLYSVVRHPMYLAATILYVASTLVLGSYFALIPMLFIPFLLAFRIVNEEKVLLTGLPGYEEYMRKVKYRMIPYIW
jgi:protein-S-isoprenylcysteine O-methyltransferase Ste14